MSERSDEDWASLQASEPSQAELDMVDLDPQPEHEDEIGAAVPVVVAIDIYSEE